MYLFPLLHVGLCQLKPRYHFVAVIFRLAYRPDANSDTIAKVHAQLPDPHDLAPLSQTLFVDHYGF